MLRELAPGQLWIAEMPFQRPGLELGARMTVVRLADGGLFIHSPIALSPALKQEIDALGPVRFIVSPFRFHYAHLPEFAVAYPEARIYAPPHFKKKLPGVRFHGVLGDVPEPGWAQDLDQAAFRGNALDDEVDFLHRPSRTLILTDLCFCLPARGSWLARRIAGFLGVLETFGPTLTFRLFTRDRRAARASVERILAWDFDRIIIAHGTIIESGGHAAFRKAFAWLLD